mgnify:CR=1 FL=1
MEFSHTSVLLNETIENLKIKPDGIYVDGTLGGAGHSSHICERLSATGEINRHRSGRSCDSCCG